MNPAAGESASTIDADVSVVNDPNNTVTGVAIALGPENPGGTLCGTTTGSLSGGVAHFHLGVVLSASCILAGSCTYTLTATAASAESGVSEEFTISVIS